MAAPSPLVNGVLTSADGGNWPRAGDAAAAATVAKAEAAAAKTAGVSGRYGIPGSKQVSLELRPDGAWIMTIGAIADTGTYTVDGTTITLTNPRSLPTVYKLSSGTLIENEEAKWARMDYVAPAPGPKNADGKAGRYVLPEKLDRHFDIRPDGTFTLVQPGQTTSGTYSAKGAEVSLSSPGAKPRVVHIADGTLVDADGSQWPRVWDAGPAPTAAEALAHASAADRAKSLRNVQGLCIASEVWAEDHKGSFEDDPNQLLAGPYRDRNAAALHCPLLHDDSQIGYEYFGKGLKYKKGVDDRRILFLSKWHDAEGRRVIGYADSTQEFAVPNPANLPPAARAAFASAAGQPPSSAPSNPVASAPANTIPAASAPPEGTPIALSPQGGAGAGAKRYGASFPEAQLPANPANYFWVVDRPDGQTKVAELHQNAWRVAGLAGVYKIRVEYRSGNVNKTVSNVIEVTVPGK